MNANSTACSSRALYRESYTGPQTTELGPASAGSFIELSKYPLSIFLWASAVYVFCILHSIHTCKHDGRVLLFYPGSGRKSLLSVMRLLTLIKRYKCSPALDPYITHKTPHSAGIKTWTGDQFLWWIAGDFGEFNLRQSFRISWWFEQTFQNRDILGLMWSAHLTLLLIGKQTSSTVITKFKHFTSCNK